MKKVPPVMKSNKAEIGFGKYLNSSLRDEIPTLLLMISAEDGED